MHDRTAANGKRNHRRVTFPADRRSGQFRVAMRAEERHDHGRFDGELRFDIVTRIDGGQPNPALRMVRYADHLDAG